MFSPKKFVLTVFLSTFVLAASLAVFGLLFGGVGRLHKSEEAHLAEAKRLEERRKKIRGSIQIIGLNRASVDRLNGFLVNRERPLAFIEAVEELAEHTGASVSMDLIESGTVKDALTFRLTVEGTLPRLTRYLALLENMPYGIIFEELSYQRIASELLRASGGGDKAPFSRLTLLLKVKTL